MSANERFFDTNVLLYLLSADSAKADRAEALLVEGGVISVQVLNEFVAVARRKLEMGWDEIGELVGTFKSVCRVVPLGLDAHDRAREICGRNGYTIYDACIIATAELAGCNLLFSEDMQHGQRMAHGLTIRNPFA